MPRTKNKVDEANSYKGMSIAQLKFKIDEERRQFTMLYPEIVLMVGERKLSDAVVLSRIFFWYFPTQHPRKPSKLRKRIDGELCLVKSAYEMASETGLSPRTVEKVYKRLQSQGFITITQKMFMGRKQSHIKLNKELFINSFLGIAQNMEPKVSIKIS